MRAKAWDVPAGGGAFELGSTTIGLFLVDQTDHRIAVGSDMKRRIPLRAGEGWILPAGAAGICQFDEVLAYLTLELPDALLAEVGCPNGFAPVVGALDPLVVEMVKNAAAAPERRGLLYRQTMSLAALLI